MKNLTLKTFGCLAIGFMAATVSMTAAQAAKVFTIDSPRMPGITRMRFEDVRRNVSDGFGSEPKYTIFVHPEFEYAGKYWRLGFEDELRPLRRTVMQFILKQGPSYVEYSRSSALLCDAFGLRLAGFRKYTPFYYDENSPDHGNMSTKIKTIPTIKITDPAAGIPFAEDIVAGQFMYAISAVICEK